MGSNSTPSESKHFSVPYTGKLCLYEAAVLEKTIQRLSNYINTGVGHFAFKKISSFSSLSSLYVCLHLWEDMAPDYFNTDQALEMVLWARSYLEDEESLEDDFDDRGNCIWLVVHLFRETELFLKDRFNLCLHVTGLRC